MKLIHILALFIATTCFAQWVPVAVNTNTGAVKPTSSWIFTDAATQLVPHVQSRDLEILGSVVVTGAVSPDCTGLYTANGQWSRGMPVYKRVAGDWYMSVSTNGMPYYRITQIVGGTGDTYWSGDETVASAFAPVGGTGVAGCTDIHTNFVMNAATMFPSGTGGGTITGAVGVASATNDAYVSGKNVVVSFDSNSAASAWAKYPAKTNAVMSNYQIQECSKLVMTGKLVLGLGVFAATNAVEAPPSSNVWYIYAVRLQGSNFLYGIDYLTNRFRIGGGL